MRLPTRKSNSRLSSRDTEEELFYITPEALVRLKKTLERLEKIDRPRVADEKYRAAQLGDLSENADYMEAKARLNNINTRILSINDRLSRAVLINSKQAQKSGQVEIGSTVTLETGGKQIIYTLVGAFETNPACGLISYRSPLGSALLGHYCGDQIKLKTDRGEISYTLIAIE